MPVATSSNLARSELLYEVAWLLNPWIRAGRRCRFQGSSIYFSKIKEAQKSLFYLGGEAGIRTLDNLAAIHAFQACQLNHSCTSPYTPLKTSFQGNLRKR